MILPAGRTLVANVPASLVRVALLLLTSTAVHAQVSDEVIVRFEPGAVTYDAQTGGLSPTGQGLADTLSALAPFSTRLVCPYWRDTDKKTYFNRQSEVVKDIVDFTDAYVLIFADSTSAADAVDMLGESSDVALVGPNLEGQFFGDPDPLYGFQWYLDNDGSFGGGSAQEDVDVNFPEASAVWGNAAPKKIAIIDSGIFTNHEEITFQYDPINDWGFNTSPPDVDWLGHGTGAASIAAASNSNGKGISSPAGELLEQVIVSHRVNQVTIEQMAGAIAHAAKVGIPVMNMSLGICIPSDQIPIHGSLWMLRDAVHNAYQMGLLMVCAAGNQPMGEGCLLATGVIVPAAFDHFVLGVGHVRSDGTRHPNYMKGSWLDVAAPGGHTNAGDGEMVAACRGSMGAVNTYRGVPNGPCDCQDGAFECQPFGGTSGATPLVSGIVSRLLGLAESEAQTLVNDEDIRNIVARTTRPLGGGGWTPEYGWGLVRADSAAGVLVDTRINHVDDVHGVNWLPNTETGDPEFISLKIRNVPDINDSEEWMDVKAIQYAIWTDVAITDLASVPEPESRVWIRNRDCTTWRDTTWIDPKADGSWASVHQLGAGTTFRLKGYSYHIWNVDETQPLGWFPVEWLTPPVTTKFAYSVASPTGLGRGVPSVPVEAEALRVSVKRDRIVLELPGPVTGGCTLRIFDAKGRLVRSQQLIADRNGSRVHSLPLETQTGRSLASGVYFAEVTGEALSSSLRSRFVVLK